jgi:NhaP-type Na+/H+ or K+/H+ antiporter
VAGHLAEGLRGPTRAGRSVICRFQNDGHVGIRAVGKIMLRFTVADSEGYDSGVSSRTILEGESLLNDASALLIYRLAVGAVAAKGFSIGAVAPTFLFAVAGSVVVGPALGWLSLRLTDRVQDVPTAIILQFVFTFGVWILADRIGLSGVLTMVCFAISVARTAPERTPARIRIPSYAV